MKSDYYTPTVISSEYMTNKFNNLGKLHVKAFQGRIIPCKGT